MEGTPVSIMEAGLAGIPIISTHHAGIPDVVLDKETGLLCPEHDVDGMAINMIQILDKPDVAKEMGANNRARIKEHFSLEKHIRLLQDAINETVKTSVS